MAKKDLIKPANYELYTSLVEGIKGIEMKGATMPYTSMNGHMFSFLSKDGYVGLRLSQPARDEFIKKFNSTLFEAHGTIMKEYVTLKSEHLKKGEGDE